MTRRLLIRLCLWYLKKYAPWTLPCRRRPAQPQPTGNEANQRRWCADIDARAAAREGR